MPLLTTYGLSEAPTVVTTDDLDGGHVVGASGRPLPHLDVQIVDGEVCVGPMTTGPWAGAYRLMLGYWERPDATAETLAGGLLHTGDLGFIDDDGYLHIRDRKSLVIIRGGANVYPAEIERVVHELDGVVACAVVGVEDERLGERVMAAVELAPGATVTAEELTAALPRQPREVQGAGALGVRRRLPAQLDEQDPTTRARPALRVIRLAVSPLSENRRESRHGLARAPKSTRSSRTNCTPQRIPKPERCATSSATVCTGAASCKCVAHESVSATARVDSARPANERSQNGAISRHGSLASRRPQVQRRLRWYEGTVATPVASTFAIHASIPKTAVARPSVDKLITVVTTETLMQRVSRCQRLRRHTLRSSARVVSGRLHTRSVCVDG